jgi:transposase
MPRSRRNSHCTTRRSTLPRELRTVNLNAAGVDVGAERHYVAVPEGRDPEGHSVRSFGAFTADLHALAAWLRVCGVKTVAMESTGIYWIPLFELLAEQGFEVKLVDPRQMKNVPGRKSDVLDCQWIQQLHTLGCWPGPSGPMMRSASCAAISGSGRCWSPTPRTIFSTSRRPSSR